MAGELTLRRATADDAQLFYGLRNEAVAVAMSGSRRPVTAIEHGAWFARALQAVHVRLYVAEAQTADGLTPVGSGRLTLGAEGAEVSMAVHPEHRGHGIGGWLVNRLASESESMGVIAWAEIRPENVPSLRAFLANGFTHGGTIRLVRR